MHRSLIACALAVVAVALPSPQAVAGPPSGSGPSSETPAIDQPPGCTIDEGAEAALTDVVDDLSSDHPALFDLIVARQDIRLFCFGFGER